MSIASSDVHRARPLSRAAAPPVVRVQNLWMSFPGKRPAELIHVLERVNLEVEPGEFVCIVGPSGCGKSTLLNIIGGFLRQSSGDVRVERARGE
jgi:NitT/TauT family transport system ATP-binding protein